MPIVGHGVDIVDTARIIKMLNDHREAFLERCFTPAERALMVNNKAREAEFLAGRFAAKEAILKVLGTGWAGGIAWTDMEILRSASGKPTLKISGHAALEAERQGITRWHISISHISTHAIGSAIGESD